MLKNRVAIITGATCGIGRNIALTLAKNGCNIVVAGKSARHTEKLPGDIYSVSKEVEKLGAKALPFQINVVNEKQLENLVDSTVKEFGKIDILINNAGALWWKNIIETPVKKYDLVKSPIKHKQSFKNVLRSENCPIQNDCGHSQMHPNTP